VQGRREARERALELLYEAESKQVSCADIIDSLPVAPDPYAARLATGVDDESEAIDALLRKNARGWSVERMPSVDRAIVRMATFELLRQPEVPTAVVVSEAVELAHQFSTDESGRYVNGLLSTIAKQARPGGSGD
jgi:N utilization substance protein B